MRIGFFLSTKGGSPLVVGLERGMATIGHHVEPYRTGQGYDLVVIANQCAHTTDYVYPEFPPDNQPIVFLDSGEYGYFTRLKAVAGLFSHAFASGAMLHDTKNRVQQERLKQYLEGKSFPYFLREYSNYVEYPIAYHPIDYPLYALSKCHHAPDREQYLRRQSDLFMSWGASHPWRLELTRLLREFPCRSDIRVVEENGTPRMPQAEYFERTRAARCSVSFDGYGSGSFRMTEVLVRCLLLQGPLLIRTRAPLIDGQTCITYNVFSDGQTFLGSDITDKLKLALEDSERSYGIYAAGYYHCMEHLTERATAGYVLETVAKHDWSKPTSLVVGGVEVDLQQLAEKV